MLSFVVGRVGLKNDRPLVGALFQRVTEIVDQFTADDVVNLISAMARLELHDEALLASLMQKYPPSSYSSEDWLRLTWTVLFHKYQD